MPNFTLRYKNKILAGLFVTSVMACNPKQLPHIVCFEVVPANVMEGQSTQVKWEVAPSKYIRNIALEGIKENLENIGSLWLPHISEKEAKNITLDVAYHSPFHKKLHHIKETKKINIDKPFFKGEEQVSVGDNTHLEWKLNPEAKKIWMHELVDGKEVLVWDDLPHEANYKIKPVKDTKFELFVIQPNANTLKDDTLVYKHDIKVEHGFFTGTRTLLAGDAGRIMWKVFPNLHDLVIEERENQYTRRVLKTNLPVKGFLDVAPTTTTEYILVLISEESQTRFRHKIEVVNAIFSGNNFVKVNQQAVLQWKATPTAKKITLSQQLPDGTYQIVKDNLPIEGRFELPKLPLGAYHYTLHVETKQETSEFLHSVVVTDKDINENKVYSSSMAQKSKDFDTYILQEEDKKDHHTRQAVDASFDVEAMNEPVFSDKMVIYFDFEKNKIDEKYISRLDEFVQYLQKHENAIVDIKGYSDMVGSMKGCQKISEERALVVRDYLVSKGIEEYRLLYRGMGRAMPIHILENNKQQAQENRRTEVILMDNK